MKLGNVSVIRWTQSAIDCYERCCICNGCPMYELIGKQCRMKTSVLELVRKFGVPEGVNRGSVCEKEM